LIVYLISVLIFFREKTSIVSAITIYICLDIITFINSLFAGKLMGDTLTYSLGTVVSVINIYVFIQTIRIKNKYVKFPCKLFGFSLFILTMSVYLILITLPSIANRETINYLHIVSVLAPISILLTIKGVTRFIKDQGIQGPEIPTTFPSADA
jgi:hypothetical protein